MRKVIILSIIATIAIASITCSCGNKNSDTGSSESICISDGVEKIVPSKSELIKNVESAGYEVTEFDKIYDLQYPGERVLAKKGDQFIDICYGLDTENAKKVFEYYEEKYDQNLKSENYYMLSRNDYFVYFISDKETFNICGFKSTQNYGTQYTARE